jgi:hypothetical protein
MLWPKVAGHASVLASFTGSHEALLARLDRAENTVPSLGGDGPGAVFRSNVLTGLESPGLSPTEGTSAGTQGRSTPKPTLALGFGRTGGSRHVLSRDNPRGTSSRRAHPSAAVLSARRARPWPDGPWKTANVHRRARPPELHAVEGQLVVGERRPCRMMLTAPRGYNGLHLGQASRVGQHPGGRRYQARSRTWHLGTPSGRGGLRAR